VINDRNNRNSRDELDIESLIRSLRQETAQPEPHQRQESAEAVNQSTETSVWEAAREELARLRESSGVSLQSTTPFPGVQLPELQPEEENSEALFTESEEEESFQPEPEPESETDAQPLYEQSEETGSYWQEEEEPQPRKLGLGARLKALFGRKKEQSPLPEEQKPYYEAQLSEEDDEETQPAYEAEPQPLYAPEQEEERQSAERPFWEEQAELRMPYETQSDPERDYVPEHFVPLQEQAPDIVLEQMREEEERAHRLEELKSGKVVVLNLRRREKKEEPEPAAQPENDPFRASDTQIMAPMEAVRSSQIQPPDPIIEEIRAEDVGPVEPEAPAPRILTLNLRSRREDTASLGRSQVFDQDQAQSDDELETLERMLAKHAEESRRRREAEAELRRQAEEEMRKAEQERAELDREQGVQEPEELAEKQPAPAEDSEAPVVQMLQVTIPRKSDILPEAPAFEKEPEELVDSEPEETEPEGREEEETGKTSRSGKAAGLLSAVTAGLFAAGGKKKGPASIDQASDAEFEEVAESSFLDRFKKKEEPPVRTDGKVIELPLEETTGLQKKLEEVNERADEFAQSMFQSDSADAKAAERAHRLAEQYIPATDYDEPAAKRDRKEEQPRIPKAPDTSPKELHRIYHSSWKSSLTRLPIQFLLAVVLLIITAVAGGEVSFLTVEALSDPKISGLLLTVGLAVAAALGLDTLLEGIFQLFRGRPGLNTLASFGTLLTLADGIWYSLIGREGPLPFCGFAALSLWSVAWGTSKKKDGLQRACGTVAARSEFERLTLDQGKMERWSTYIKEPGSTKGFGSQMQEDDGSQRVYRYAAPVMLIVCIAFGILSVIGQKNVQMLLWTWSVIFVLATPLSSTAAYGIPYLTSVKRLLRNGAILAGWDGVEAMKGDAGIILKDRDLFPEGAVQFNGIQNFGSVSLEKLTGCTASMIREADVGLSKIFDDQIRIQGGFYRRVDELKYSDAGGYTGTIRGDKVLIGTAGFMKMQGIELEQGQHLKNAVFCVINGQLQGIFALNYNLPRNVEPNLDALIGSHVYPVLALRDFNITPAMLQQRFGLPVDRMQYPPADKRHQLSARNQPHNPVLGALIFREGIGPYTDAILGGRKLRKVVRSTTRISILASVVGAMLGFYLTMVSAYVSLSPMNILFFLIMWLIPVILIGHGADKF